MKALCFTGISTRPCKFFPFFPPLFPARGIICSAALYVHQPRHAERGALVRLLFPPQLAEGGRSLYPGATRCSLAALSSDHVRSFVKARHVFALLLLPAATSGGNERFVFRGHRGAKQGSFAVLFELANLAASRSILSRAGFFFCCCCFVCLFLHFVFRFCPQTSSRWRC